MLPAWRDFVISDLQPDAAPPNQGILAQALLGADWRMPSIASWNSRALFHSRQGAAADKAKFFAKLANQSDVTCVQEAHVSCQEDVELLCLPSHRCFWSGHSPATGGLLVAIKSSYLDGVAVAWSEIVVGRIAVLTLSKQSLAREIIVVHLSPDGRHSWENLVRLLADYLDSASCVTLVVGDCNVILEQADRLEIKTGAPCQALGPRVHTWRKHIHANDIHAGLTHYNAARQWLSCLDRFLINVTDTVIEVLGARGEVVGLALAPPAASDHWPIRLTFQPEGNFDAHPRWTFHHPSFGISAQHWAEVLALDSQTGHKGLTILQSVIDSAVVDVRSDIGQLANDPFTQRSALLAALHAAMKGERGKLRTLMERADWNLKFTWSLPQIALALLPKLEQATRRVEAVMHREREEAEKEGLSRSDWAALMHRQWRKLVRTPAFTVSTSIEVEPLRTEDEAKLLACYWAGVFQRNEPNVPLTPLAEYVVTLPWSTIHMEPQDFEEAVRHAANTTPGPDGISYGHLKCIAAPVGRLMAKLCDGLMQGQQLPAPLTDSYTVFLNKKEASIVLASDTRPIVLDNVLTKVIPGALTAKLAPLFAKMGHACQYGFVKGRTIPQALIKLEELAFRISKDDRFGALLFVDVKQAFPSLRRKWILEVCWRSGATMQQLKLLEQMMRPNRTLIKWKGRVYPGYKISTGLNQGSPWS
eukprot:6492357-Amphidinium_carterae.2